MIIISAGCSVAAGQYLNDPAKKYAALLAKHYNAELADIAKPGASNEHIAKRCAAVVAKALKTYNPKDIVVVVGWTETGRTELFNKQTNSFTSLFLSDATQFNKTFRREYWSPAMGYYQFIHSFNYLNNVCKANGVRIINIASLNVFPAKFGNQMDFLLDVAITDQDRVQLKDVVNRPSFHDFAKKKNMIRNDNYPNEQSHRLWFEHISATFAKVLT